MAKLKTIKLAELTGSIDMLSGADEDEVSTPSFAFCSATRRQASKFHYCRENLVCEIADFFRSSPYRQKQKNRIDVRKMRLLVLAPWYNHHCHAYYNKKYEKALKEEREKTERSMQIGLKLVNHFEKMAKWPLTQLYRATYRYLPEYSFMYLFIGSSRWMRSPHMVSLFVLLVRLGRIRDFEKFRSHQKLTEICKDLSEEFCDYGYNGDEDYDDEVVEDISHLRLIYDKIEIVMKHFNYLFGVRTSKHSFTKAVSKKLMFGEGIGRLCGKSSADRIVAQKFKALCKKYGR